MRSTGTTDGGPATIPARRRPPRAGTALALAAGACALAATAGAPPAATAADAPRLVRTHSAPGVTCVPGPANTVRARVRLWMKVVNDDGLGEWADHMEVKVRLEATTPGLNFTRPWSRSKTPYLVQNRSHRYDFAPVTDNVKATASWRVHIRLIWHRPAPIRNIRKDIYRPLDTSCATVTGGSPFGEGGGI